jgi:hypothetical protein
MRNYLCFKLVLWLLLWICYGHYNLSSIVLHICFKILYMWHTQPQIPSSATVLVLLLLGGRPIGRIDRLRARSPLGDWTAMGGGGCGWADGACKGSDVKSTELPSADRRTAVVLCSVRVCNAPVTVASPSSEGFGFFFW